ncbi:hypothetical protein C4573_02675 [Candidatus Woesearchaeota archaeon]|nr:MAG: hypothetical protein C4573_02675 [Candidatus Woesearchaeota archaeon]
MPMETQKKEIGSDEVKKRKVALTGLAIYALTLGAIGLSVLREPKQREDYIPVETINTRYRVSWYVVDSDGDGTRDRLDAPRHIIYDPRAKGSLEGDSAFAAACQVRELKNEFSAYAGAHQEFYWLCSVKDTNNDGYADEISWPRMREEMPVYSPIPVALQAKADSALKLEEQIQKFIWERH